MIGRSFASRSRDRCVDESISPGSRSYLQMFYTPLLRSWTQALIIWMPLHMMLAVPACTSTSPHNNLPSAGLPGHIVWIYTPPESSVSIRPNLTRACRAAFSDIPREKFLTPSEADILVVTFNVQQPRIFLPNLGVGMLIVSECKIPFSDRGKSFFCRPEFP
jgi:hypothetical protein